MSVLSPLQREMSLDLRERLLRLVLPGSLTLGLTIVLGAEVYGWPLPITLFGSALIVLPLLAWCLLTTAPRLAVWLLVLGYLAIALGAPRWLGSEAAAALLPLPAGLAGLILGPGMGAAIALLASLLLLTPGNALGLGSGATRLAVLGAVWATQSLVWAATGCASQAIAWWSASYERMRELLEEARTQRVELKQVQDDLVHSNTELARVSERLRAMAEVAEEARRAKEEFAANVSHELRTPLNMIIGFSEMMIKSPRVYGHELPPKLLADIGVILTSSRHLASLVDDVLDLSQIDAGRLALSREWASLSEIIQAAALAVTPLFESKGLYLKLDVPTDLPPLFCDRVRIRQVILNLLSNAGRYAERGGAILRVRQENQDVVVSVADTGPGISPLDRAHIFEPFAQAGAGDRRHGGSGLGLAISKRFVELHQGRMWFESVPGQGTVFHLSLPTERVAAPPPASLTRWFSPYHEYEPRARRSKAPEPRLAPRFVILERGNTLQRLLRRYYEGAEVVVVPGLREAYEELGRRPAQALIVNESAPGSTPTAGDAWADLPYGTPVIHCWLPGEKEAADRLGLVKYLTKPVSREALLATLEGLRQPIRSVLVVDDEPEALQLYSRMLASAARGYRTLCAPTGQRALALLRERLPDAMLLDLVMPGMDGYAVLQEKSRDEQLRDIPVVAVSAQDPSRGPVASNVLTVGRSGGLYVQDVLSTIEALSAILAPPDRLDDRGQPGSPRG